MGAPVGEDRWLAGQTPWIRRGHRVQQASHRPVGSQVPLHQHGHSHGCDNTEGEGTPAQVQRVRSVSLAVRSSFLTFLRAPWTPAWGSRRRDTGQPAGCTTPSCAPEGRGSAVSLPC
jgi:hypothetical protein